MAIDMKSLSSIIRGDQSASIAVKRQWLSEVFRLLVEADNSKAKIKELEDQVQKLSRDLETCRSEPFGENWDNTWDKFDSNMDRMFGKRKPR